MSGKIRWLAILAACSSAIFLAAAYGAPFLLLGAIIQPWARTTGRWLTWIGALYLSEVVVPYGTGIVLSTLKQPSENMVSLFPLFLLATVFVYCCDIALVIEAVKSKGTQWSCGKLDSVVWISAAILSAWCVWQNRGTMYAYSHEGRLDILLLTVAWDAIIVAFDVALILHALKTRRTVVAA